MWRCVPTRVAGAFLGNILGGLFGTGASLSSFSPIGLLWAFVGAVVLLGLINLVRGGSALRCIAPPPYR